MSSKRLLKQFSRELLAADAFRAWRLLDESAISHPSADRFRIVGPIGPGILGQVSARAWRTGADKFGLSVQLGVVVEAFEELRQLALTKATPHNLYERQMVPHLSLPVLALARPGTDLLAYIDVGYESVGQMVDDAAINAPAFFASLSTSAKILSLMRQEPLPEMLLGADSPLLRLFLLLSTESASAAAKDCLGELRKRYMANPDELVNGSTADRELFLQVLAGTEAGQLRK